MSAGNTKAIIMELDEIISENTDLSYMILRVIKKRRMKAMPLKEHCMRSDEVYRELACGGVGRRVFGLRSQHSGHLGQVTVLSCLCFLS